MAGELRRDLRYAARILQRQPLFTGFAVLTLALGIGANTTVFSVVHATLLRTLPFPDPDRLYRVTITVPPTAQEPGRDDMVWSFPKYRTFLDAQRSFQDLAAYSESPFSIRLIDGTERVTGELVAGRYLELLGIAPLHGRGFSEEEGRAPAAPAAILLGHSLWQRSFGGDPEIVGRSVNLDGSPATVIGVMPAWFRGLTGQAELWRNVAASSADELNQAQSHWLHLVGRLGPGVQESQALADMGSAGRVIEETYPPPPWRESGSWGVTARPLDAARVDPALGRSIVALAVAVALVLLLACVNLAGLLLARAAARSRDTAVRLAVGARRRDLVRQFLLESSLLAGLGGAAGLGISVLGLYGLRSVRGWLGGALGGRADLTQLGLQSIGIDPRSSALPWWSPPWPACSSPCSRCSGRPDPTSCPPSRTERRVAGTGSARSRCVTAWSSSSWPSPWCCWRARG